MTAFNLNNTSVFDLTLLKNELLEIHRSKISLHHSKAGYNYPTIRLPLTFFVLAGLPTKIYQIIYDGASLSSGHIAQRKYSNNLQILHLHTAIPKIEIRKGLRLRPCADRNHLNHSQPIRAHFSLEAIRHP